MKPFLIQKETPRTPRDVHTPKTNISANESFRNVMLSPENLLQNHLIKKLNKVIEQPLLSSRSNTRDYSSIIMPPPKNTQVQLPKITYEVKLDTNTKYFIKQNFDHFPKKEKFANVNSSVPEKASAFTFRPLTKNFKYLFPGASHQRSTERLILGPIVLSPTSPRGNKIRQLSVKDFMGPITSSPSKLSKKFSELKTVSIQEKVQFDEEIRPPSGKAERNNVEVLVSPRRSYMKKQTLIRPKIKMKKVPMIQSDPSLDETEDKKIHNLEMINESGEWGAKTHVLPTESDL